MGSATQFLRFERQGSTSVPILELKLLQKILKQSRKKKLAFVSSCGSARQGKSFILNFILRSILKQAEDEDDYLDWDQSDQPLEGFAWANGEDQVTQGMWITNEPTILKNTMEEEVAIFLIDTQGIFDEYSTLEESRIILGISLLLSTTTVFSMKAELPEEKIATIANVINLFHNKFPNQKFGGLMMLIKDWTVQQDYTHGEQGGSKYLNKRLTISPNHSQDSKLARTIIQEHLSEVNAFLFPYPGDKATKDNFTGSLNEILPKFSRELEAFLWSPRLLNLDFARDTWSKVFEELITMVSEFNHDSSNESTPDDSSSPSPKPRKRGSGAAAEMASPDDHSANIHPRQMVESLVSEYTSKLNAKISESNGIMTSAELTQVHKHLYEATYAKFHPDSKSFSYKQCKNYEGTLEKQLISEFEKAQNEMEASRRNIEADLDATSDDMLSEYEEQVKTIRCTWSGDKVSRSTSQEVKKIADEAVKQFQSKSAIYREDLVKPKEQRLKNLIKQAFDKHVEQQREKEERKQDAEFELNKLDLVDEYKSRMKKLLTNSTDPESRLSIHNKCVAYMSTKVVFQKPAYEENLKQIFEQEYQKLIQNIQISDIDEPNSEKVNECTVESMDDSVDTTVVQSDPQSSITPRSDEDEHAILNKAYEMYQIKVEAFLQNFEYGMQERFNQNKLQTFCNTSQEDSTLYIKENLSCESLKRVLEQFKTKCNREYVDVEAKLSETYKQYKLLLIAFKDDIKNDYISRINDIQQTAQSEKQLRDKSTSMCEELIQRFGKEGLKFRIPVQESVAALKSEFATHFNHVVLRNFQLQSQQSHLDAQEQVSNVTRVYTQEMEKHFAKTLFTKPADFLQFHDIVASKAMKTLKGKPNPSTQNLIQDTFKSLYKRYSEKNDMNTPGEPAIGIDLGTTYCCVAIHENGQVQIIKNELNKPTIPSFVALLASGEIVGEDAKLQAHENPQETVFDAKRLIGRKFDDEDVQKDLKLWPFKVVDDGEIPKIEVNNRKYTPEVISAKILKHIKTIAERHTGRAVTNAVITVPAYFNDGQRQATRDAAEIAGLQVLQIINEPTAAAIAYHLHRKDSSKQNVLVYDLGGGTFDVSVLTMTGGKIEVKAVGGDTHLGGEDFDQALVDFCVQKFQKEHRINLAAGKGSVNHIEDVQASRILRRLRNECENQKKNLSSSPSTTISVTSIIRNLDLNITISKGDFEQMNSAKFSETIRVVQKALLDSKLKKEDINEVVLVGGSTKIPKIRELLQSFFNGKELCTSVNADEAVAYGAAIQAAILNGCKEQRLQGMSLHDVTPMSVGIEVLGGGLSVVIPRNTSVPVEITKTEYRTTYDNQTEVEIIIFEGEDRVAERNHRLGGFTLKNIPKSKKGVEKIHVTMKVNKEGILKVIAVCASNKASGDIVIEEHKGRLTSDQIEEERRFLDQE